MMNSIEVEPLRGAKTLGSKELWRGMVHFRARDHIQPTAGRQQQAGKEDYSEAFSRWNDTTESGSEQLVQDAILRIAKFFLGRRQRETFRLIATRYGTRVYTAKRGEWFGLGSGSTLPTATISDAFLAPIKHLEKRRHVDAALDVLYDRIDSLLRTKQFPMIDQILQQSDIRSLSVDLILGLLTATLPAKSKLPSRARFFAEAASAIKSRGEWEESLLTGLEP